MWSTVKCGNYSFKQSSLKMAETICSRAHPVNPLQHTSIALNKFIWFFYCLDAGETRDINETNSPKRQSLETGRDRDVGLGVASETENVSTIETLRVETFEPRLQLQL